MCQKPIEKVKKNMVTDKNKGRKGIEQKPILLGRLKELGKLKI